MRKTFRQLFAWREAHKLALSIYKSTRSFPSDERFGITSQLRRASTSIGAQLAEGSLMPTMAHRLLYYQRAYASASEVDNFLELSKDLGYLQDEEYKNLLEQLYKASYLLSKLVHSQKPTSPTKRTTPTPPHEQSIVSPTQVSHNHAPIAAHSPAESIRAPHRR